MKLRHNETGHIFQNEDEFRRAFPNVSFPPVLDQNAFDFANVSIIVETTPPEVSIMQRVEYAGIQLIDDKWTEVWSIHPKYDDPVEQQEWETECLQIQWNVIRGIRASLLAKCDYTMMADTPITPESKNNFITYRQALRDITNQTDPFSVTWPTEPEYIKQ